MARTARKISNTNIYHIILRGVNHTDIFEEESDYKLFLDILGFYKKDCQYEVLAYCIMTNHVHLLLRFSQNNLSDAMKKLEDKFIWWYNKKYDRCGHLFQERFKSEPVESERYLRTVFRYIHQNPLKAGLVSAVCDYRWSSYSDYQNRWPALTDTAFMDKIFGGTEPLLQFVNLQNDDVCMENRLYRINDDDVIQLIKEKVPGGSPLELCNQTPGTVAQIFQYLSKKGASVKQISRVTGFSRNTVTKYCKEGQTC